MPSEREDKQKTEPFKPRLVRFPDSTIHEEISPGVWRHRRDLELSEGGDYEI